MINFIGLIILFGSVLGMTFIVIRKIPVLAKTDPENYGQGIFYKLRQKINSSKIKERIPFELLLHKILSKARVFFLRMENNVGFLLAKLRQRMIQKKNGKTDNYWQGIKGEEEDTKKNAPPE